jgi:very-short-patch-repair endonuclease
MVRNEKRPRGNDKRVPRARSLRRAMTDAERKLWWHLRGLQVEGTHFRRQATIGPYFADFACHDRKLIIEVDGGGHAEQDQIVSDDTRTQFLKSRGYHVLRFWNHDVLKDTEAVMSTIYEALTGRISVAAPHP